MYIVIIIIIGIISSIIMNRLFREFNLVKNNYRKQLVPYSGGSIIFISTIISFAVIEFYGRISNVKMVFFMLILSLAYTVGFFDDLFGNTDIKGVKCNLTALLNRTISMGIIKGIFFIVLSCYLYYFFNEELWILKGIMTSLFTNLFNLIDLRPGRCIKLYFAFWLLLGFTYLRWTKELFVIFSIVLAIYYFWNAYGYSMLGESGSNLVGFITGLTVSEAMGTNLAGITGVIIFLVVSQFILDKYSFTQFIEGKPMFNFIDRFLTERQNRKNAESRVD